MRKQNDLLYQKKNTNNRKIHRRPPMTSDLFIGVQHSQQWIGG